MNRASLLRAVHAAYRASLAPASRRFVHAAHNCARVQEASLLALVRTNQDAAYGRAHGFAEIHSVRAWQDRVPIVGYDALESWVLRAASGEPRVLTEAPVRLFERTSGSTAPNKLVPYTDALLAEFGAATGPWLHDLYTNLPALRGTRSYWSISPAARAREHTAGGIPIGLEDDTAYFGPLARTALRMMLAVPSSVARAPDIATWRAATARHLAAAGDLGLVSVWHPSFMTPLLREIADHLDEILAELPAPRARDIRERLRTQSLTRALWPRLSLVSWWADGPAADADATVRALFSHAHIQPKGLLATEGVVSFPLLGGDDSRRVAAITSHFMEFVDLEHPTRRPLLAHEVRVGATYAPVLSTGGGFYRYRLGDGVRCDGRHLQAPVLTFVGRVDQVSDLCGEKLNPMQVGVALSAATRAAVVELRFALLAPSRDAPARYRLYAEPACGILTVTEADALREALERTLGENHGYAYARALGQLGPLEIVIVHDGAARHQHARAARGERMGSIKPTLLDSTQDWEHVFGTGTTTPRQGATA